MTQQPLADRSAHRSGVLLEHLARRIRLRAEAALRPLGLRPRHLVALTAVREQQGCSQQALATTLEMDGTNVVLLLNELEQQDLVERRRSTADRRRHDVALTETGVIRLAEAERALTAVEDEVLGALDASQRETLYHLLQLAAADTGMSCLTPTGDEGEEDVSR